jgi:hypothetical protein
MAQFDVFPNPVPGRLTPIVVIDGIDHVLMTSSLAGVAARDLGIPLASLGASRLEILAAIDYLSFGV